MGISWEKREKNHANYVLPRTKMAKTVKKGLKTNEIPIKKQEKNARMGVFINLEQVTGLEPVISAWKANVFPLHYTCLVRAKRFELIRRGHWNLNPARLPIPPRPLAAL
jgi:hypothetical protein